MVEEDSLEGFFRFFIFKMLCYGFSVNFVKMVDKEIQVQKKNIYLFIVIEVVVELRFGFNFQWF